jgi:hypothetical protein
MAYVDEWGNLKDDFYVDRGYHNKPAKHKVLGPYGGPKYPSDSDYPSPFGTDLFDRVEAPTKGKQFLDGVVASALGSVGGLAGNALQQGPSGLVGGLAGDAAKKGLGGLIGGIGGTFL